MLMVLPSILKKCMLHRGITCVTLSIPRSKVCFIAPVSKRYIFQSNASVQTAIKMQKENFLFINQWTKVNLIQHPDLHFSKRLLHTSPRQHIPPWLIIVYKFKGLKVLKFTSAIAGRSVRKVYDKLPVNIQRKISRHKLVATVSLILLLVILYYSYMHYDICPLTGRRRWISFTKEQMLHLADIDHKSLSNTYQNQFIDKSTPLYEISNSLVKSLIEQNSDIPEIKRIKWNLNVINDDDVNNAFVLPNGEIYLFTGMIQLMNDWQELAIVLSHEMAHSILGHVQEQQSFLVFGELLLIPFLAFLWFWFQDFTAFIVWAIQDHLYPMLFEVIFSLPYSRQLESEADVVGLEMATKACFDPRWAVLLWDKMAFKEALDDFAKGEKTEIKFLSSHPSHHERASILEEKIPAMLTLRNECGCSKLISICPLSAAHKLRDYTNNIRKRVDILEEMKLVQSNATQDDKDKYSKLNMKLYDLTEQYQKMLAGEEEAVKQINADRQKNSVPTVNPAQTKSFLSAWSGVIGRKPLLDFFKASVFKISGQSSTLIQNSQRPLSRNYYDAAYF